MVNIKSNLKNKIKGKNNVSSNFNIEQSYIFKCEKARAKASRKLDNKKR